MIGVQYSKPRQPRETVQRSTAQVGTSEATPPVDTNVPRSKVDKQHDDDIFVDAPLHRQKDDSPSTPAQHRTTHVPQCSCVEVSYLFDS